jgi:DNA repair protein RadC
MAHHARRPPTIGATVHPCPLLAGEPAFRPGPPADRPQVNAPDDVLHVVAPLLRGHDRERGVLVALDTRHRVIATRLVSIGTADHTFLAPREIYRDALLLGASAVVVAHNHPSGDATPSTDDERITRRLADAGATIGVDLLDHLIVGDPAWTSLARQRCAGL